ncbi:sodium channel protein Nach [Solenopsis invicta]|uniref:sodium channel protein Nach n=1 Tax=Solenopsis invicta TaxID=13686 RepID=UPI00193DFAB4|nr:sodium channel protein Nach [Solenopsis invicta]
MSVLLIFGEINGTTSRDSWIHGEPHKSSHPQITILFRGAEQTRHALQKEKKENGKTYKDYVTTPLITTVENDTYPTTTVSFPAIAICSFNRISRQSATDLATNIFNSSITNKTIDEILDIIRHLGNLYSSFFHADVTHSEEVDNLLTTYFKKPYDVTNIMKNLTPQCSMMLVTCKLHGQHRNCSDIFEFRKTQDGFCCTFNYARESDDIPNYDQIDAAIKPDEIKVMDIGIDRGLTVVMDPLLDDYFYSMLPMTGWKASRNGIHAI